MSKICKAKHTDFQPKEWKCPNCGADNEYFCINDGPGTDDCDLLHDDDFIICDRCDGEWDGKRLSKLMKVEKKKCPCCDGTCWIVEDKK